MSASSAGKKYRVDKKDIDMLNLPYLEKPNPYYTARKMKLYYEFMIRENLHKIQKWRQFKQGQNKQKFNDHVQLRRDAKFEANRERVIYKLEMYLIESGITRSKIIKQYIENDLMTRFLQGKIKNKQLYDIVDLIDKGDDKKLEEDLAKKEVELSQKRYAKQLEKQKEKEKKQEEELEQQRIESKKETDLKKK